MSPASPLVATLETLLERQSWTDKLFSFKTTRPAGFSFKPGQFARLGIEVGRQTIWRAYSIVSATGAPHLEFYSVLIPDGEFSQALNQLQVGDPLRIEPASFGFMTVDRIPAGSNIWLFAPGTGLAPYISMLRDLEIWRKFKDIILVHGARYPGELSYARELEEFHQIGQSSPDHAAFHLLQTVTRSLPADAPTLLHGRITDLFANGTLEQAAGILIDPDVSRMMLCGNPDMIQEMRALLRQRGLRPCRVAEPGHFLTENYW